jgi:DNA-binding NtrC family response regulator
MRDEKILWVEDESALREIMCELLTGEGLICTSAENGLVARNLISQEHFSVIISDFNMPIMDGATLLFWCRENKIHTPFIFVSGNTDRIPVEDLALRDCCSTILQKPFSIDTLLTEIDKALSRRHDYECKGFMLEPEKGDYKTTFPYQHIYLD